jgi:hypothetical protein
MSPSSSAVSPTSSLIVPTPWQISVLRTRKPQVHDAVRLGETAGRLRVRHVRPDYGGLGLRLGSGSGSASANPAAPASHISASDAAPIPAS